MSDAIEETMAEQLRRDDGWFIESGRSSSGVMRFEVFHWGTSVAACVSGLNGTWFVREASKPIPAPVLARLPEDARLALRGRR